MASSQATNSKPRYMMAEIAIILQRHDKVAAEVVKSLRKATTDSPGKISQNFQTESKVIIRQGGTYKRAKPPEDWRMKYHRRVKQESEGFCTPAHVPYAAIGDVILDNRELVFSSLGREDGESPGTKNDAFKRAIQRKTTSDKQREENLIKSKRQKQDTCATKSRPKSDGGMKSIRDRLRVQGKKVRGLRAGQWYDDYLRREEQGKALEQDMRVEQHLINPEELRAILDKTRLSRSERGASFREGLSGTDLVAHASEEDILDQSENRARSCRTFCSKLNSLELLLSAVYELNVQDLRRKISLPKDFFVSLTEKLNNNTECISQATNSRASRASHMDFRLDKDLPWGVPQKTSEGTAKSTQAWGDFAMGKPQIGGYGIGMSADFMSGSYGNRYTNKEGAKRGSFLTTAKNLFQLKRRRAAIAGYLPKEAGTSMVQPVEHFTIWQQVANQEKQEKDAAARRKSNALSQLQNRKKRAHPGVCPFGELNRVMGEGFNKVRIKSAQKTRDKLDLIESQQQKVFEDKLLMLHPARLYESIVSSMRRASEKEYREYKKANVQPAKWYNNLTEMAESLDIIDEFAATYALNRLYMYAMGQVNAVPFVKAKLCLVIQSMPISDLCSIHMQEAIQFLMLDILGCTKVTCSEWMLQRKIAPLISDTQGNMDEGSEN